MRYPPRSASRSSICGTRSCAKNHSPCTRAAGDSQCPLRSWRRRLSRAAPMIPPPRAARRPAIWRKSGARSAACTGPDDSSQSRFSAASVKRSIAGVPRSDSPTRRETRCRRHERLRAARSTSLAPAEGDDANTRCAAVRRCSKRCIAVDAVFYERSKDVSTPRRAAHAKSVVLLLCTGSSKAK